MVGNVQAEEPTIGVSTPSADDAEERVSLASNWMLVWWRFKKHRLAMASGAVLILFYAVVLVPDFFSTQDPEATDARLAFIPVQPLTLFDGLWFRPSAPAVDRKSTRLNSSHRL